MPLIDIRYLSEVLMQVHAVYEMLPEIVLPFRPNKDLTWL